MEKRSNEGPSGKERLAKKWRSRKVFISNFKVLEILEVYAMLKRTGFQPMSVNNY